ncbi:MAG: type II secretion system secretin GspD [Burkholderiaceae bacterium]|nr:type II secretion system secretin GspD [Burkholderiaceae bacterium]
MTTPPALPRLGLCCLALTAGLSLPAAAQTPPPPGSEATTTPAPGRRAAGRQAPVTLNFVNADIEAVSRAMAVMMDRQILVDARVKGVITLYSEQPLPVAEAWRQYLAGLRGLGFAVVDASGLLKVVPEAEAKLQTGTVSVGPAGAPGAAATRGDQIITQVFRLNHENPNNLVAVLRPLISPNNTINANPGNSSLVITDYADNLARLGKIIAALDQPSASDIDIVPLKHGIASDMATLVQKLADSSGAVAVPGAVAAGGGLTITADARSNALIVRAANPARLAATRALIERLDMPGVGGPVGQIHVVYLKNAEASKLAAVLRAAFGGGSGGGSSGGSSGGFGSSLGGSALASATPAATTAGNAAGSSSAAATAPLSASAQPSTGGFIQADPATNSLIITAAEPLYRQMRSVIDQLDGRRAQVYIESMVVEVSGDNAADFGFQWQGLLGQSGDKWGLIAGTNSSIGGSNIINLSTTLAGTSSSTSTSLSEGLNIGLLRNYGGTYALGALARLLQSNSNINIVSTPNLITLDNEEAKIIVGSNVPFITGQYTSTGSGTTSPFQTIERKDVGLTLRIRPQVGESGTVRMQIFQESSSVSETVAPGTSNAGPSTDKRSIESTVVVDDGGTLVLGGLIEDRYTDKKSKVPVLGDLPWVGPLFRSESRSRKRTNLMVFLRPVVLRDAGSANALSLDRYEQIRARQQGGQPAPSSVLDVGGAPLLPERPASATGTPAAPAAAPAAKAP